MLETKRKSCEVGGQYRGAETARGSFSQAVHSPSTEKYALPESCTTFEGSNRENFSFTVTPERETRPKRLQGSPKKWLMEGEGPH